MARRSDRTTKSQSDLKKLADSADRSYQRNELLHKSWRYLNVNFESFSEENKLKIALELAKKDITIENNVNVSGDIKITIIPAAE